MLEELKQQVYEANMLLPKHQLITFTWGNVSGIDKNKEIVAIKPSGIEYDQLRVQDIVLVNLSDGAVVEGKLNPSSDTDTHLELYRHFQSIAGVVHTHSQWATIWSQAGKAINAYGTTHADYFNGSIPCTRAMTEDEIKGDYELNTGKVIVETFNDINPEDMPAVLVKSHGPFTWGKDPLEAVHNAVVLDQLAMMAFYTEQVAGGSYPMQDTLLNKHFYRKHGENAYYGQNK